METNIDKNRMEKVRSCGLLNGINVEVEGSRGGLCLARKTDTSVNLRSSSKSHIDVTLKEEGVIKERKFTRFYGSPYVHKKNNSWNLLRYLGQQQSFPWLVSGDFNEIMFSFVKSGSLPREERRIEDFQLEDIRYLGVWFTWERGNLLETNIKERLDRGVANEKWR